MALPLLFLIFLLIDGFLIMSLFVGGYRNFIGSKKMPIPFEIGICFFCGCVDVISFWDWG